MKDPHEALKKLAADGLIRLENEEMLRTPVNAFEQPEDPGFRLTPGQEEALEEILPCLKGKGGRFLLHGVTGSGKTEVFMAAVRNALNYGKSAIILVPEIALTPQMVSWFRGRFGPVAAVIHSRLSPGERFDEWRRIRRGDARVIIGARSAVFAPARDLGLIVVDEEHESTYLNDHHPQYDAREVARKRCDRENATLVLASATPSILSFARARRGDYMLLEMPRRVMNRPLPEVEIIDMREELENGNRTVLSGALRKALKDCTVRGEQAMLLMNRRGYNSFVSCRTCGYVVKCPNCDISMTYHMGSDDGLLRCHYCGQVMKPPEVCPECGGKYIRYFGAGTQKVEEEVHKLLPGVATVRMDYDTTGGKDGHGRILEEFRSGRARILIGTQMIAKGLDFPNVTLVGVLNADASLNMPDFRAAERTFQLITQVAGRAGRADAPGRVVVQNYDPEHYGITCAAAQDYRAFYTREAASRRLALYPPFTV
ncbi:MAG: primosomal protein N', partial [Clostridia bacterium]|nr:primosomal protein N' [Clostridia bacterium]